MLIPSIFQGFSGAKPHGAKQCLVRHFKTDSVDAFLNGRVRLKPGKLDVMSLGTILIILLILALIGVLPTWGYSNSWGYGPGGIVGLLLVIVIILALLGRL